MPDTTIDGAADTAPDSFLNLKNLMQRKARMVEAAEVLPGQINEARDAATATRQAQTDADVSLVNVVDEPTASERDAHEENMATLTRRAIECEELALRLQKKFEALEPAILQLDSEIEAEMRIVSDDADHVTSQLVSAYEPALDAAVAALVPILARIAAVFECNRANGVMNVATDAYVPVLHYRPQYNGYGEYSKAPNRISLDASAMQGARAEVSPAIQAVRDALRLAASHKPYIPMARRRPAYLRKGDVVWETGPRGRFSDEIATR